MSINLSLDRIRVLVSHLPAYTRPTCHIAGTNGKGSVAALVSSILLASSPPLSVGRFNSPHLVTIYDCIALNNASVSPKAYAAAREEVEGVNIAHGIDASSFELLTCTALLIFERAKVDVVVLEAGMGGRLDATNIIPDECVLVSALTAVDLDHQAFLGNTVTLIAEEKAAIARAGRPFVLGRQRHQDVKDVVKRVVVERGGILLEADVAAAEPWLEEITSSLPPPPQVVTIQIPALAEEISASLPLHGAHQVQNLSIAAKIVDAMLQFSTQEPFSGLQLKGRIQPDAVSRGIQGVIWPGRLSYHQITLPAREDIVAASAKITVLVDGAHNPASSATLARHISDVIARTSSEETLASKEPLNLTFILALSHSPPKTAYHTFRPLLPLPASPDQVKVRVALVRFTPPEGMPWVKSVPPSGLQSAIQSLAEDVEVWAAPDVEDGGPRQLEHALQWIAARPKTNSNGRELVVVAGSLYLVADLYRLYPESLD